MTGITIKDGASEFRISLQGRFTDAAVQEVRAVWVKKLSDCMNTRITVDISEMTDYDAAGRKLLREMHNHGIHFAASTPASLVLLSEISSPKRLSVTMLPEQHADRSAPRLSPSQSETVQKATKARAAGKPIVR